MFIKKKKKNLKMEIVTILYFRIFFHSDDWQNEKMDYFIGYLVKFKT